MVRDPYEGGGPSPPRRDLGSLRSCLIAIRFWILWYMRYLTMRTVEELTMVAHVCVCVCMYVCVCVCVCVCVRACLFVCARVYVLRVCRKMSWQIELKMKRERGGGKEGGCEMCVAVRVQQRPSTAKANFLPPALPPSPSLPLPHAFPHPLPLSFAFPELTRASAQV